MALTGTPIAFIGIGRMGAPMARRLLEAGAALTVTDRAPARCADLLGHGASAAASIAEAVRGASISLSMVPDDAALESVAAEVAQAAPPGLLHIDMSTVSPAASARAAALLGPAYLRAPVSGSTSSAASGQLAFFVSGSQSAIERAAPVLGVLGSKRMVVGAAEEARSMKLLVNMVVGAMPALLGEAMAFGLRQGLDRGTVVDALGQSVVATPLLSYKAAAMKARDWTPAASVDLLAKDLDLALSVAQAVGLEPGLITQVRRDYARHQAAGEGDLDFFRLSDRS